MNNLVFTTKKSRLIAVSLKKNELIPARHLGENIFQNEKIIVVASILFFNIHHCSISTVKLEKNL